MRVSRFISTLGLVALVASGGFARAGVITAVVSVSGPGGTGAGLPVTAVPNNDNAGVGNTNLLVLSETFTAIAPINAVFTVAPSGGTTEYFSSNVTVNNLSGVTWTGFQFTLTPLTAGDGLDFDTPNVDPPIISTSFPTLVMGEDSLSFSGGTVPSGGVAIFTFSIDVPDAYTTFTLTGIPTAAIVGTPEPTTLASAGIATLAGLGIAVRRRRRAASA